MAHKKIDLTGKKIGDFEIIEEFSIPYEVPNQRRKTIIKVKVRCICGFIFSPYKGNVLSGKTKHCIHCNKNHHLIGKKFGKLLVLHRDNSKLKNAFLCQCDCGEKYIAYTRYLRYGKNICCPKCRYPKKFNPKLYVSCEDHLRMLHDNKHIKCKNSLIGKKFGYIKVIEFSHWEMKGSRRRSYYKCKCKCGKITFKRSEQVKTTISCGCYQKEMTLKGENQKYSKLKNKDVAQIRELIKSKLYSQRQIAKMYNVTDHLISNIKLNKTYNYIS